MPNLRSSIKDMIKSRKNQIRNRAVLTRLHTLERGVRSADSAEKAKAALAAAIRMYDRAVTQGIVKRGTSNRKKSRLSWFVAKTFAAKT